MKILITTLSLLSLAATAYASSEKHTVKSSTKQICETGDKICLAEQAKNQGEKKGE